MAHRIDLKHNVVVVTVLRRASSTRPVLPDKARGFPVASGGKPTKPQKSE